MQRIRFSCLVMIFLSSVFFLAGPQQAAGAEQEGCGQGRRGADPGNRQGQSVAQEEAGASRLEQKRQGHRLGAGSGQLRSRGVAVRPVAWEGGVRPASATRAATGASRPAPGNNDFIVKVFHNGQHGTYNFSEDPPTMLGDWLVTTHKHDPRAPQALRAVRYSRRAEGFFTGKQFLGADANWPYCSSPDGRFLLTVGSDQSLQIWNAKLSRIMSLYVSGPDWIVYTPAGYYAATPGGERLMHWKADELEIIRDNKGKEFQRRIGAPHVSGGPLSQAVLSARRDPIAAREGQFEAGAGGRQCRSQEGRNRGERCGGGRAEHAAADRFLANTERQGAAEGKAEAGRRRRVKSQPITGLRVFIDGKPATDGYAKFEEGQAKVSDLVMEIKLPGEKQNAPYRLTAMVESKDAYDFSSHVEVEYIDVKKLPVMHVLAIGVSDYKTAALKLNSAASDARDILDGFKKCAGGGLFKVVNGKTLLDGDASPKNVLAELDRLQKEVNENDLLVVFFAGHGVKNSDDFYLLTAYTDTKALKEDGAGGDRAAAEARPAAAARCCCFSMPVSRALRRSKKGLNSGAAPARTWRRRPTTRHAAWGTTARYRGAGRGDGLREAQEKNGHGLFTSAIVKALNKAEGVRFNPRDHTMYFHHLWAFVLDDVANASEGEQHPFPVLPALVPPIPIIKFAN